MQGDDDIAKGLKQRLNSIHAGAAISAKLKIYIVAAYLIHFPREKFSHVGRFQIVCVNQFQLIPNCALRRGRLGLSCRRKAILCSWRPNLQCGWVRPPNISVALCENTLDSGIRGQEYRIIRKPKGVIIKGTKPPVHYSAADRGRLTFWSHTEAKI